METRRAGDKDRELSLSSFSHEVHPLHFLSHSFCFFFSTSKIHLTSAVSMQIVVDV